MRCVAHWTDSAAYEVTENEQIKSLPGEPLNLETTPAGRGEYLPIQGKFKNGEDARRHTFSREECSLSGHVAAFTLLMCYADAYADSDEEWEALAGRRLDTILQLCAHIGSTHVQA